MENGRQARKSSSAKWRWYHGVLFYAGIQIASFGLAAIVKKARPRDEIASEAARKRTGETEEFYNRQLQPVFAPPAWAFAPAWAINNFLAIYGLLRVLNMPEQTPGRRAFIKLQALSWADFALFSAATFSLRSNVNGAVLTKLYFALTLASLDVALVRLRDRKTALSLSTLTAWLALASVVSATLVAWNGDDFYGLEPLTKPAPAWLKQRSRDFGASLTA